jgi:hypothetical protein
LRFELRLACCDVTCCVTDDKLNPNPRDFRTVVKALLQEKNVAILGIFLVGRSVPRLRVKPPDAAEFTIVGSANCTRALLGALQRDGKANESISWLQMSPKIADLESRLDR